MMSEQYEPIIVGFLCNWCSYRAADLAGTARMHYAPNMRPIRVMCSGRVDPQFVLKALREGADGVLIAGCHPGECHYVDGNIKALRRFILLKQMLRQWGIEEERVQLVWAAASEGNVLAAAVDKMTEELRALGPLRWSKTVLGENGSAQAAQEEVSA
jgi:F420-non-reducing hydrogenase iron-sulfur subunit